MPPHAVHDTEGRSLRLRTFTGLYPIDENALVEMYDAFDASQRAQGLPPRREPRVRSWLDALAPGLHAVATHRGHAVGHAVLVPDSDGPPELAIFVHPDYQGARVGTVLLRTLLDAADARGVSDVHLFVERTNRAALALYRAFGFTTDASPRHHEIEMSRSR